MRSLILLFLIALFVALGRQYVSSGPLAYDEADYMLAARRGFVANYWDEGAIGIGTFVKTGLAWGFRSEHRTALSDFIRQSGDINFERHYHGPLYFYWIIGARALGATSEAAVRWASYVLLAVTAALAALLARALAAPPGDLAAFSAALMTLTGAICAPTAAELTPHAIYVPVTLAAFWTLFRWARQPDTQRLMIVGVALGVALVAMEYAPLLMASALLLVVAQARGNGTPPGTDGPWRTVGQLVGAALATTVVLWPAGLLKLSLVKHYAVFAYITLVRGGEYGEGSALDAWAGRLAQSPVEYLLILVGVGYYVARLRSDRRTWPVACYAALMLLTTIRNTSPRPTYVSSLMPPLYVLCAIAAERLLGGRPLAQRRMAVAALAGLLVANGFFAQARAVRWSDRVGPIVGYFEGPVVDVGPVLVPRGFLPSLHYYYPTRRFGSYLEDVEGLAATARLALDSGYVGLLYAGPTQDGFGRLLPPERIERVDTIAVAPAPPFYAVYYQLRR